jgi:hypothetical protein
MSGSGASLACALAQSLARYPHREEIAEDGQSVPAGQDEQTSGSLHVVKMKIRLGLNSGSVRLSEAMSERYVHCACKADHGLIIIAQWRRNCRGIHGGFSFTWDPGPAFVRCHYEQF